MRVFGIFPDRSLYRLAVPTDHLSSRIYDNMVHPLRRIRAVGTPFIDPHDVSFIIWVLPPPPLFLKLWVSVVVRAKLFVWASLAPFPWNFLRGLPLAVPLRYRGGFYAIALGLFGGVLPWRNRWRNGRLARIVWPGRCVRFVEFRAEVVALKPWFAGRFSVLIRLVFNRWSDWSRRGLGPAPVQPVHDRVQRAANLARGAVRLFRT